MINGVNEREESIIKNILKDYPYQFYFYGSRVKGDYTKSSDLDILVKSENEIPEHVMNGLELKFNESLIPYVVNIADFSKLNENFYKLIEPTLVSVF